MGFSCGMTIHADGKTTECLHESRRKALSCTRRLVGIDQTNELNRTKAGLAEAIGLAEALEDRVASEMELKDKALATVEEQKKQVAELAEKVKVQEELIASLEERLSSAEAGAEAEQPEAVEEETDNGDDDTAKQ